MILFLLPAYAVRQTDGVSVQFLCDSELPLEITMTGEFETKKQHEASFRDRREKFVHFDTHLLKLYSSF